MIHKMLVLVLMASVKAYVTCGANMYLHRISNDLPAEQIHNIPGNWETGCEECKKDLEDKFEICHGATCSNENGGMYLKRKWETPCKLNVETNAAGKAQFGMCKFKGEGSNFDWNINGVSKWGDSASGWVEAGIHYSPEKCWEKCLEDESATGCQYMSEYNRQTNCYRLTADIVGIYAAGTGTYRSAYDLSQEHRQCFIKEKPKCTRVEVGSCTYDEPKDDDEFDHETNEYSKNITNCGGATEKTYEASQVFQTEVREMTGFELSESIENTVSNEIQASLELGAKFKFSFGEVSTKAKFGTKHEVKDTFTEGKTDYEEAEDVQISSITTEDSGTVPPGMELIFKTSATRSQWKARFACTGTCYAGPEDEEYVVGTFPVSGTRANIGYTDASASHQATFCGTKDKCFDDGENCQFGLCDFICKAAGCGGSKKDGKGYTCKSENEYCKCGNDTSLVEDPLGFVKDNMVMVIGSAFGVLLVLCLVTYCCCKKRQKVVYATRGMA